MKKFFSVFTMFLACILFSIICKAGFPTDNPFSTQKRISGTITDALTGNPISGVTVQVGSSTAGTTSDNDGHFELSANGNDTLVVTHLAYESLSVPIQNRDFIPISLTPSMAKSLEQVVIVGYGTEKKGNITGSISTINGGDVAQNPAANLSNSIAGRVPGVVLNNRSGEPGNDESTIFIRGRGTLNDNGPLIVIDGVANRGGFDRLNPDAIESFTILKDASAAIYGAQAANGVILITTKRGTKGDPTVTYNGNFGLTKPTRIPVLLNAWQYATYINEVKQRQGVPPQFTEEDIQHYRNGDDPLNYPSTDWYGEILRDLSPQTRHSLSLDGGTDRVKYFVSGEYLFQDGIFKNSATKYNQYNLRSNLDAKVTDNLTLSLNISGRVEDRRYSNFSSATGKFYTIFRQALGTFPILPAFYPNGLPGPGQELGLNPALMATGVTGSLRDRDDYLLTDLSFNLKLPQITKGLYLSGLASYDFHFNTSKMFDDNWDVYQYNRNTNEYTNLRDVEGPMNLTQSFRNDRLKTYNIKLGYENNFGSHNVTAFAAYEQSEDYNEGIEAYRTGFANNLIQQISFGSNIGKDNSGSAFQTARQNIFGRITYNYQEKYLFEFIIRHDGSFNFPKENRWGTFPGISAGWRVSKEKFFSENVKFINDFKLKASWGRMGNDKINSYQFIQQYLLDAGYYLGPAGDLVQGLSTGVIPNPNVTWERADTKDIGFESTMLNGKLGFDFDYFYSKRTDILIPRDQSIPSTTGLDEKLPDENIGKVNNHGIELNLSYRQSVTNDFSYSIGANYTFTRNKIVFLDEPADIPDWQRVEGHPMDSWLVYKSAGVFKSQREIDEAPHLGGTQPGDLQYIDVDGDGEITSDDMVRIYESPIPESIFGFTMGFRWKNLGLDMLWQGQGKAMQLIQAQMDDPTTPLLYTFEQRWTPDQSDKNFPASFDRTDEINTLDSDFWLQDATFIRLKTVELSYNFPQSFLDRLKLKNLRVFLSGYNILTFSKLKHYDPEINVARGDYYPQTKVYNAGISLSF